ncbi:phage tail tip lysozyme [Sinorhizobium meliloti]|uniref:phage tail tip lysozyme n=1 Tax=Rhizobium meliloti TaxID=382 RepID=UPI001F3D27F2|nr:phage tail tip lysozyme [Sinorhizobium meliloti]
MVGFLFGGSTNETPETLKRKRELAMAIMGAHAAPKNIGEGLSALGAGIAAGVMNRRADKAEGEGRASADALFSGGLKGQLAGSIMGLAPNTSASSMISPGVKPAAASDVDMSGNDIYSSFMDTVDNTIKNPFGLAAVAATGKAESRFSPGNVNRTWSDPSQSGDPGTAGGIMSWRGPRLESLQAFAAKKGEQGNGSPQTQAEFLLQEDPNLVTALNGAKSTEEAQQIMNNAWKFAGYNQPGGEAANRLGYANAFLPNFQGQQAPQQVASLDPSIGMPSEHPQSAAPLQGPPMPSLSDEVAEFEKTPEYAARFPGRNVGANAQPQQPSPQPQGIPPQFQGSQQLADAQGGMMSALMGGAPASPEQIAQARARGAAQQQPQQQSGPDQATLYQILTHPFSTPEQKAVAQMMLEQQMQAADPVRQMQLEKGRLELEEARKPKRQPLINAGNGNVYDPNEDKWLTAPSGSGDGSFRFNGNSVEAQALNGLMDGGRLTPEQAQQLAAGKTITGPNGEIIFMTPQGVFGQPANGGQAQPIGSGQSALPSPPAQQGNIQITKPKVTVDEKEAATFADRMNNSGSLIDEFGAAAPSAWDQFIRGNDYIPDMIENLAVSGDFQKLDQARRDFINAQLRRESGAVISPEEFDNANKQYFPQFGDGDEVIEQKRRNRQTVIQGMTRSAGPTYGGGRDNADPLGIR